MTELEKSLKDSTLERDDLTAQLDAEKVSLSAKFFFLLKLLFATLPLVDSSLETVWILREFTHRLMFIASFI